jgi:hypothetical protein
MSQTTADACVEACRILGTEFRALYGALPWSYCRSHVRRVWAACPEASLDWLDAEPLIHAAWAAAPVVRGRPVVPAGVLFEHTRDALERVQACAFRSRALVGRAPSITARAPRAGAQGGG